MVRFLTQISNISYEVDEKEKKEADVTCKQARGVYTFGLFYDLSSKLQL